MTLSIDAVAGYAYAAGLRGEALVTAVAIAGPESGYNEKAYNGNRKTGDKSYGLWQINMIGEPGAPGPNGEIYGPARRRQFGITSNEQLFDPATNARAMYSVSGGGQKWTPWSTFKRNEHRAFLDRARAAAQAAEGRSGGAVAAGALPLEASAPGPITGERVPPGGGLLGTIPISPVFPSLTIDGGNAEARFVQLTGVGGHVSLSVNSVMEIELVFVDARRSGIWRTFLPLAGARYGDFNLIVAKRSWGEQDGIETFNVVLRSAGVHAMRQPNSGATWANLSPSDVLAERVAAAGMRFYAKGTPTRTQIVRLSADDAGRSLAESDWEMGQRLAREEGFWFFEAGGAVYFAPPTWLAERGTKFPVRHMAQGSEAAWNTLGFPTPSTSVDEVLSTKAIVSSAGLPLPAARGQQVRPGMVAEFRGSPGFNGPGGPGDPIRLLVTDVSWDIDGGIEPVQVEATQPIDPVPDPPDPPAESLTGHAADPSLSAGITPPPGVGGNVSNGGKGSYGYQYDGVGTQDLGKTQPGVRLLMNHLVQKFRGSSDNGTYVPRNIDGTKTLSMHAEGRAGDSKVPVSSILGTSMADYLVANATLFGIQYVIWNGRSWSAHRILRKEPGWKTYTPPNGKTDNTSMHRDHVHWELCWEAARYLNERAITAAYGNAAA